MNWEMLSNLADPAVLFFFLGLFAGAVRSNLEIPPPVTKFISLYLLMALGFKGGQALSESGLSAKGVGVVAVAVAIALLVPAGGFLVLRRRVNAFDSAAIAATYGSVSAVTFIAASQYAVDAGTPAGGYLTVALILMESPAIIMAVLLATWSRARQAGLDDPVRIGGPPVVAASVGAAPTAVSAAAAEEGIVQASASGSAARVRKALDGGPAPDDATGPEPLSVRSVLHEAFTDGANILLIGSLIIGAIVGKDGGTVMKPFVGDLFKGFLAFFLLEMGLLVARQLREARDVGPFLIGYGLATPLVGASLALAFSVVFRFSVGDAALLAVLAASASYIVVPAVVRYAIPEARPSRYLTMALAVTFPFNIVVGIPLYHSVAQSLLG